MFSLFENFFFVVLCAGTQNVRRQLKGDFEMVCDKIHTSKESIPNPYPNKKNFVDPNPNPNKNHSEPQHWM
jgi:hypothetical protein